jgi:hypothetical protein
MEASAQVKNFHLINNEAYINLWGLMGNVCDHGLALQGAIGELISHTLSIYYKALLTTKAWEVLCQLILVNHADLSHNSGMMTFEDAFCETYIHFLHYGRLLSNV